MGTVNKQPTLERMAIWVVKICSRVANDDSINFACIGGAKYCAEISRLFYSLQDNNKWICWQVDALKAVIFRMN